MADLAISSAENAVISLVGCLARILEDEAKLLSGVHRDVQFIKDEIESVYAFLQMYTTVDEHDDQMEVWTKQVRDFARHAENSIDIYMQKLRAGAHYRGPFGPLWRILWFLSTLKARHGLATQMQEFKLRAVDVSARRSRYGIRDPMPHKKRRQLLEVGGDDTNEKEDLIRRQHLLGEEDEPPVEILEGDTDMLVRWLTEAGDEIPRRDMQLEWLNEPGNEMPQRDMPLLKRLTDLGDEIPRQDMRLEWMSEPEDVITPQDMRLEWRNEPGDEMPQQDMRLEWLNEPVNKKPRPRVISIVQQRPGDDNHAGKVYEHSLIRSTFGLRCWVRVGQTHPDWVFRDILKAILSHRGRPMEDLDQSSQIEEKIQHLLEGSNYLIILDDVRDQSLCLRIISALPAAAGAHCAVLLTTTSYAVARCCSPYSVFPPLDPLVDFFLAKAISLVENSPTNKNCILKPVLRSILSKCATNLLCMKAFLHVLYINPMRNTHELESVCNVLTSDSPSNTRHMLMLWYNDLPLHYKNCLMYLSIFPEDDSDIRRTSVVRRWVAENLITGRDGATAQDEAERCFNVLLAKRFLLHRDISASRKVKSCRVNGLISKFISEIAREKNFVDADLQPDLSHRISTHNRSQLLQVLRTIQPSRPNSCWNISKQSTRNEDGQPWDGLTKFLEILPAFSRLGLLRVLDLQAYDDLKDHHLENICKIFQLRYLNLRRTKVTKLPKQIENLQQLETLDIRETSVSSFATEVVVLPMLKHMLAGFTQHPNEETESFSTVRMPRGTGSMTNLQILCHIDVSGKEDQLIEIGKLLQLRKLGVVLGGKQKQFKHLYQAIEKLNKSLLSLSICVKVTGDHETPDMNAAEPTAFSPPKLLQSLKICGITGGLPRWIKELHRLAKLTLRETHLRQEDITILGKLNGLRCLRLRHRSYVQTKLTLPKEEFQNLEFIIIEGSDITDISFDMTPKIEKMVWNFTHMKSIDGIDRLPSLNRLELIGDCDPTTVRKALSAHPNKPVLTHNEEILGTGEDN